MSPHSKDRRQEPRLKVPLKLSVFSADDNQNNALFETNLVNISHDGLSFYLPTELKIKKRYRIELTLNNTSLKISTSIIWNKSLNEGFLHGAELASLTPSQTDLFLEFINTIQGIEAVNKNEDRRKDERRNLSSTHKLENKPPRSMDRRLANRLSHVTSQSFSKNRKTITLKRVAITGLGIVSPNGIGVNNFFSSLMQGASGIKKISRFNTEHFQSQWAGEVSDDEMWKFFSEAIGNKIIKTDFSFKSKLIRRSDRSVQFAAIAAIDALINSKLNLSELNSRLIGISTGTTVAGLEFAFKEHDKYHSKGINFMNPYTIAAASPNSCSGELSSAFKIRGPSATFSQGCTSGAIAISYAFEQIQKGRATIMLTGGTDSPLQESTFAAFCRSGMLAASNGIAPTPRPFDKERDGIVLSEGAAILILEDLDHALARNATIYAEVISDSNTCDGFDMIKSRWHGKEAARAIEQVIFDSGLSIDDISVIFAHAMGSKEGDGMESRALNKALGNAAKKIPVTNVKALIGYSQAACVPIEIVAATLSMKHGVIPAINSFKSSESALNISAKVRPAVIKNALINCFGFGGKNVCLVLKNHKFDQNVQ